MDSAQTEQYRKAISAKLIRLQEKIRNDEIAAHLRSHAQNVELPRAEAALKRLDRGTYGECDECGQRIEEDRLERIPEITTCKGCAKQAHQEGRALDC